MKRRERRRTRRDRREADEAAQTRSALFGTTAIVFAFAAFFISLARKVLGFWEGALWEPMGLIAFGLILTLFGALLLGRIAVQSTRGVVSWILVAAVTVASSGWLMGLRVPAPLDLVPGQNPLDTQPVRMESTGLQIPDGPLVAVRGEQFVLRKNVYGVGASDAELRHRNQLRDAVRDEVAAHARLMELMGQRRDLYASLVADRCEPFEALEYAARTAQDAGIERVRLVGMSDRGFGVHSSIFGRGTAPRVHMDMFADGVDVWLDGRKLMGSCDRTLCLDEFDPTTCSADFDLAPILAVESLDEPQHFSVRVADDVPVQTVVSLLDGVERSFGRAVLSDAILSVGAD